MPNVKAPKYNVTYYDRSRVSPGYWFVAPYLHFEAEAPNTNRKYVPCQVGPHIYDQDGKLVWTGSCLHDNRNVFDFKTTTNIAEGTTHLSYILQQMFVNDGTPLAKGAGYILNDKYMVENAIPITNDLERWDLHEFNILPSGKTALAASIRIQDQTLAELGRPTEMSRVASGGFLEIDIATGAVLFDWDSRDKIPLHESDHVMPWSPPEGGGGLDYIHVNAADKNQYGDYLMSARYTSTIYLISGQDGHIIWRLGGKYTNFAMDFTFSKQHNARFVSVNETHTILSFLNNASDDFTNQEEVSSGMIVELNTVTMTATLLNRYTRPDGGLTRMRGNLQSLDGGNVFMGWSAQGYHSEHAPDGTVLMEAQFQSPRFNSYRSYKFPFIGKPQQPPALVASVFASKPSLAHASATSASSSNSELTTVFHVSWNGATEVAVWNFYSQADEISIPYLIGNVSKHDFESVFVTPGYWDFVSAEALDRNGNSLGWSMIVRTRIEGGLQYASEDSEAPLLVPDDPASLVAQPAEEAVEPAAPATETMETIVGDEAMAKEASEPGSTADRFMTATNEVVLGMVLFACLGTILICWWSRRFSWRPHRYLRVASSPLPSPLV
ncbi:uncharacterized protein BP01DRAFT_151075 [Aspergillus saccharolyticus JOP 1030-1]|uniref:Arylsulfotransferase n=1 Tax=Aspergillus saccharolyticus JOP 1030-1 TaxID=1450539 RepID=A0A318ZLS5_9EURO|nr:hypothetical protein BP01DRAFT_151075 [Aspergillus saccharolyticus JOP 1030-1]PYH48539.1 hypothetical protein BP01DRAFT_151075 [Aspergillus saccharolyticus JOP 1030-1]